MRYTADEVFDYIKEEDVRFIRLSFCDITGKQKNISIQPGELKRAFRDGIAFDASAIRGFGDTVGSDLFLVPDPATLSVLPWRPSHGKVVRMFSEIRRPDGTPFERDSRLILRRAVERAKKAGITVSIGTEYEFYLFLTDENGAPTHTPFDRAGYMDVAPADKGENVRREICLTLIEMGMQPERSHHEEGPGQNEIDCRYCDALTAADNAVNFVNVVRMSAERNGLWADFSPKPLANESGNGMHINLSVASRDGVDYLPSFMAGILSRVREMTAILNPTEASYARLGVMKAPKYITWSSGNRSQLVRVPAATGEYRRMELRSPDPEANPYLAFALLIHAGLDGIEQKMTLPTPIDCDLYRAPSEVTEGLDTLPASLSEAIDLARESAFIQSILPGYPFV